MSESSSIGIAGAGLIGRMTALELLQHGYQVTLFDRDVPDGTGSCGAVGAGMLAPACELETAPPSISDLGALALDRWPSILEQLPDPVFFQREGTVVVAHPHDTADLNRFVGQLRPHADDRLVWHDRAALRELEPGLSDSFTGGWYVRDEGQVDNQQLMAALSNHLHAHTTWRAGCEVRTCEDRTISWEAAGETGQETFDWVIDCRGLGARGDLPLRGVRGEVIRLEAPDVTLKRPVRMMHPRYPLYIVPRTAPLFLIGASSIESDDMSPISVRSMMELLSAAYALHPAFGEARVISTAVQCRPAFTDNHPRVSIDGHCIQANGLYRHGFLLAPAVSDLIHRLIRGADTTEYRPLLRC
ncbi:MAG TPA: glycine oxidase ThiO [Lentisphaeria bacterium]|nr:glycine oxidase ThiO [Lentisphaeria bacterium]